MKFCTKNPSTEEILATYSALSKKDVDSKIASAHLRFKSFSKTDMEYRGSLMLKLADELVASKMEYATLMAKEMGKPIKNGLAEIEKCALVVRHYVENAKKYLAPCEIKTNLQKSLICYQPLGVIFAIMPWNFPFWQVFRFVAPNLMAGNVVILKHAPNVIGSGEAIAEMFARLQFPSDVFQHFIIDNDMAEYVISNDKVKGVTLTGSERAGSIVASHAGKYMKRVVLELGGNDPYIVFKDADLDLAVDNIVTSRLNNSGQVCISAKRIIVDKKIASSVTEMIIERSKKYVIGDPLDNNTNCGPLARADLRNLVHEQVLKSVKCGAKLLLGGIIPAKTGYFYPVTVLTDVAPNMPAFDDEIFGPVFSIIVADDEKHAIELANQSRFGLSSAIFTQDISKAQYLAVNEIEAGSCFVNTMSSSNPLLPFGGINHSGFGRELGREGIIAFMNIKTIGIA